MTLPEHFPYRATADTAYLGLEHSKRKLKRVDRLTASLIQSVGRTCGRSPLPMINAVGPCSADHSSGRMGPGDELVQEAPPSKQPQSEGGKACT